MSFLQIILALLSTLSTPVAQKILACLFNPANTTWALKLACIVAATPNLAPGTPEAHVVELIKQTMQAADKAGATPP